jgi:hypothetical protein
MTMIELRHAEVEITASAERVWRELADFTSYPQWNPFTPRISSGRPWIGEPLKVRFEPQGARAITLRVKVINVKPKHELRWRGHLLASGVIEGDHSFVIRLLEENRVLFIQREVFKGLLVPLLARALASHVQLGYEEVNLALKQRCEASPAGVG